MEWVAALSSYSPSWWASVALCNRDRPGDGHRAVERGVGPSDRKTGQLGEAAEGARRWVTGVELDEEAFGLDEADDDGGRCARYDSAWRATAACAMQSKCRTRAWTTRCRSGNSSVPSSLPWVRRGPRC